MSSFNVSDSSGQHSVLQTRPPREELGSENRVKTHGHSCDFVSGCPLNLTTQTIDIKTKVTEGISGQSFNSGHSIHAPRIRSVSSSSKCTCIPYLRTFQLLLGSKSWGCVRKSPAVRKPCRKLPPLLCAQQNIMSYLQGPAGQVELACLPRLLQR